MLRRTMLMFLAAVVVAALVAQPAFAQADGQSSEGSDQVSQSGTEEECFADAAGVGA